jgi:hypothetical protein
VPIAASMRVPPAYQIRSRTRREKPRRRSANRVGGRERMETPFVVAPSDR